MEDFDGGCGVADVDLFTREVVRDRVVMAHEFDLIVNADTGDLPVGVLIRLRR
jgi:hypothetical protein